MKKYIDWGREKEWIVIEDDSLPSSFPFDVVLNKIKEGDMIYLESGIPKHFLKQILDKGARVFLVDALKVKQLRDNEEIKKNDFADAIAIKKFVSEKSNEIIEFTVRNLETSKSKALYYLYKKTTQHLVSLKNQEKAFEKEYGTSNPIILEAIKSSEKLKRELLKQIVKTFRPEISLFQDIKGLGERYVVGILLEAHPQNFPNVTRYLSYCGLKSKEFTKNRYNRSVNSLYHEVAKNVIMHKDEHYYPLYLKIKEDIKSKHPEYTQRHIDNAAKNRIATFIAKEFYSRINNLNHQQKIIVT